MDSIAVKISNLSKSYKIYQSPVDRLIEAIDPFKRVRHILFPALKELNLVIPKGSTFGFLGHNGAGKSTLMRLIAGGLNPSTGSVEINGKISFLSLGQGFNPEYSGRRNIYLGARLIGYSDEEIERKLPEILEFSELNEFIEHPVKTYSAGMYSRLAFSIAISLESEIIVIDEVLSVGDIRFTYKCYEKLKQYKESGKTVLLVTHDVSAVMNYCDTAVWLKEGKVVQIGAAKNVAQEYYNYMTYGQTATNLPAAEAKQESKITKEDSKCILIGAEQGFGTKEAVFSWIKLVNTKENSSISSVSPEENVKFIAKIETKVPLQSPIISIHICNEFGVLIFGLNNEQYNKHLRALEANKSYICEFSFQFPLIKKGPYFAHIGLVDGMYPSQTQHHIVNEAFVIDVFSEFRPTNTYSAPLSNFELNLRED